jgi:tetratricopeptide (TPR) repeat protein
MVLARRHLFFNHQGTKGTKNTERKNCWVETSNKNSLLPYLVPLVPWWLMLLFVLIPSLGRAQILTGAGDAFPSMNLPDGAKASALGGAFSAWADDTSAIYWNPAGMVWLPKIQIETAFNQWFQDSFFQDIAVVWPKDWGAIGARISYVNLGSITLRNDNGTPLGSTVTPEDWGGTFAAAGKLGNLSVGLAAKVYSETLSTYYGYGGLGIDAGALYKVGDLDLAGGFRNVGIITGYNYPTEAYTGTALALGPKNLLFHLASDATFTDGGVIVHHGLEIGYQQTVFLRAGYQWLSQTLPSQDQAGLSGGAGIALGDVTIDYAMTSYGNLGLTNQVSIAYQFTEPKSAAVQPEDDEDARTTEVEGSDNKIRSIQATPTAAPQIKIKVSPPPPPGVSGNEPQLTMRAAYHIGIQAYKARDYEKAAHYLKKSLALPSGPAESVFRGEANSMLGIIYQYFLKSPGHLDLARQYYKAALEIDPTNSTAQKHLPQLETN